MTTLIFYDENQPVALTAPELSVRDIALPSHREVGITKLEICTPSWRQKVEDVSFEQYFIVLDALKERLDKALS